MNETVTKMQILNEDYKVRHDRSPIDNVESRLKTPESILKKMMRNQIPFNVSSMEERIFDIAGVRVVCPFISDVFSMVDMIKSMEDVEVVREKDYINNPKESGYRSYHMIVKIPIYLTSGREEVHVEIQIRTMAMDFWASLEHKIKYKNDGDIPEEERKKLVECAETIALADKQMMSLAEKGDIIQKRDNGG
jgi:putative GTP pyrophosphokinase